VLVNPSVGEGSYLGSGGDPSFHCITAIRHQPRIPLRKVAPGDHPAPGA